MIICSYHLGKFPALVKVSPFSSAFSFLPASLAGLGSFGAFGAAGALGCAASDPRSITFASCPKCLQNLSRSAGEIWLVMSLRQGWTPIFSADMSSLSSTRVTCEALSFITARGDTEPCCTPSISMSFSGEAKRKFPTEDRPRKPEIFLGSTLRAAVTVKRMFPNFLSEKNRFFAKLHSEAHSPIAARPSSTVGATGCCLAFHSMPSSSNAALMGASAIP
mmetsp:Transcript_5338/g.13636  ORF Transcript_5338/g.13636 Transcript_5338/m.13636 type:complete len:220 (+) Transcript_5338:178-837(+)